MLCSTLNNISKDSSLYKKITLKVKYLNNIYEIILFYHFQYNMNMDFLESLVTKISHPRDVKIEYKFYNQQSETEDYKQFDKYVEM